jgi:hypothetical protein
VLAVRCKIAYYPVEAVKIYQNRQFFGGSALSWNCFIRFTVQGTVLPNNVFFCNMLWRSAVRSYGL